MIALGIFSGVRRGRGAGVATELFDCPVCGSAQSIERGLCQVCLTEFGLDTKVIALPTRTAESAAAEPEKIEALQAD